MYERQELGGIAWHLLMYATSLVSFSMLLLQWCFSKTIICFRVRVSILMYYNCSFIRFLICTFLTLFHLYIHDLSETVSLKFIYANDINLTAWRSNLYRGHPFLRSQEAGWFLQKMAHSIKCNKNRSNHIPPLAIGTQITSPQWISGTIFYNVIALQSIWG